MPRLRHIIKHFQEKDSSSFLRFLLLKENELRSSMVNTIKSWYQKQLLLASAISVGPGLRMGPKRNHIYRGDDGRIIMGSDVTIYTPIELVVPCHIVPESTILIGDRTRIGKHTSIRAAKRVEIGRDCLIASWVRIYDYNGHPLAPGGSPEIPTLRNMRKTPPDEVSEIVIGNNVWIGENSFIQRGVRIGDNSIVAANSVVIKDVPENVIVFGAPARVILWLNKIRPNCEEKPTRGASTELAGKV
jgi:maltose O-acetyltransferase